MLIIKITAISLLHNHLKRYSIYNNYNIKNLKIKKANIN